MYRAPIDAWELPIVMRLFVDHSSVEIFTQNGQRVLTAQIFPSAASVGLEVCSEDGTAELELMTVWPLRAPVQ